MGENSEVARLYQLFKKYRSLKETMEGMLITEARGEEIWTYRVSKNIGFKNATISKAIRRLSQEGAIYLIEKRPTRNLPTKIYGITDSAREALKIIKKEEAPLIIELYHALELLELEYDFLYKEAVK